VLTCATPALSSPSTEAASPTALVVDEWGLRRGRDLIEESERLRNADIDEFAAADFFGIAFDPDPQLLPACVDARRHQFISQMLDTPEYHALHADTQLDDLAASIAAAHFAEQFAQLNTEATKDKTAEGRVWQNFREFKGHWISRTSSRHPRHNFVRVPPVT